MGNICRSPAAEGVFRHCVEKAGLAEQILIDSAGTHNYHVGDPPDTRMQRAALRRGYDLSQLRGRQVAESDFNHFDYVLAMDNANLAILHRIALPNTTTQLKLFLEYAHQHKQREVPDPYYGGADGFEQVLDMVEDAAQGFLQHIHQQHLQKN